MSAKHEARQRATEESILQYKAVVDYLSTKTDINSIGPTNQACISKVLLQGGWVSGDGTLWVKNGRTLDLIKAGIEEFSAQYEKRKETHLRKTVKNKST